MNEDRFCNPEFRSDCGCGLDFLIYDFTFLFFLDVSQTRYWRKKTKHYIPSITFVIQCLVGLVLDSIDYGIIVFTADNIDVIFIVYSVFIVLIFVCILWKKRRFYFYFNAMFQVYNTLDSHLYLHIYIKFRMGDH